MGDQFMDMRLIEFAMTLIAQELNVKLYDGKTARGRLYTIDPVNGSLILKNFIVYDENGKLVQQQDTQLLTTSDFIYVFVDNVQIDRETESQKQRNIQTDSEINQKKTRTQKDLVKWHGEHNVEMNLNFQKNQNWDQFQVNNEKFGIQFDYTDDKYTTKLNLSEVSTDLKKKAQKLENELKNQPISNRHQMEDRGFQQKEDEDEEAIYSAVLGSGAYKQDEENPLKGFFNKNIEKQEDTKVEEGKKKTKLKINSDSFHTNAKNEQEDKKLDEKKVETKINKENIEDFSAFKFNKIEQKNISLKEQFFKNANNSIINLLDQKPIWSQRKINNIEQKDNQSGGNF